MLYATFPTESSEGESNYIRPTAWIVPLWEKVSRLGRSVGSKSKCQAEFYDIMIGRGLDEHDERNEASTKVKGSPLGLHGTEAGFADSIIEMADAAPELARPVQLIELVHVIHGLRGFLEGFLEGSLEKSHKQSFEELIEEFQEKSLEEFQEESMKIFLDKSLKIFLEEFMN